MNNLFNIKYEDSGFKSTSKYFDGWVGFMKQHQTVITEHYLEKSGNKYFLHVINKDTSNNKCYIPEGSNYYQFNTQKIILELTLTETDKKALINTKWPLKLKINYNEFSTAPYNENNINIDVSFDYNNYQK